MSGQTKEAILAEVRRLREVARQYREGAAFADDPAARRRDLETAESLERAAAKMEAEATELEAGQNRNRGLYRKYIIQKADGSPVDPTAEYFVLRLDVNGKDPQHIRACRTAVLAYASKIADHLPQLAADLRTRYGSPFRRTEVLEWHTPDQPPDADTTVLLSLEGGDDPVWLGFWDGERWWYVDGTPVLVRVVGWAHLPVGVVNHG